MYIFRDFSVENREKGLRMISKGTLSSGLSIVWGGGLDRRALSGQVLRLQVWDKSAQQTLALILICIYHDASVSFALSLDVRVFAQLVAQQHILVL